MAQAIHTDLGGIPQFECHGDPTSVGARWRKWKRAFELFVVGKGIDDIEQKKALLLHCAGMQVQDVYFTFPAKAAGENETAYSVALQQLDDYFTPQLNVPYERHLFRNMTQQRETVDQFVTRLRQRADNCEFTDLAEQIRDQVIEKCSSHHLRRKLLERGRDLTLVQLQTIARALEASEQQANRMEGGGEADIAFVKQSAKYKRRPDPDFSRQATTGAGTNRKCYRCGSTSHLQSSSQCPARDKECYKCHGIGHFSKCCKSKDTHVGSSDRRQPKRKGKERIRLLETDDDVGYAFSITDHSRQTSVHVDVGGVEDIAMIIDSGASCNVIDETLWIELKQNNVKCTSQKVNKQLFAYGSSTPLEVLGCFTADLTIGGNHVTGEVVVIKGQGQALLGRKTAVELGVLKLGIDTSVNAVRDDIDLFDKYQSCFEGLGKLKDFELDIPIDSTVKPVAQPLRRIPFSLRDQVEKKLEELEDLEIIEKVEGPTPWVSPVVVVPKGDNDIRLCIDMRRANSAIIRERHPIPTVDEVLYDLNQSTIFSKLDIKWAFHQIELAESSRPITTFVTHKGLYRYKRLMFGISCAPEMYQRVIQQILQGCEGVRNIFDDIIVHASSVEEHDKRLEVLLNRLQETGLTLNRDKCILRMSELSFMGHMLSARGIGPEDAKVQAVKEARHPETSTEVRSFLGMVNYSSRFIPNLATIAEPLRRLTRKGEPFIWNEEHENSFNQLKESLANTDTLGYFDRNATTSLITDASPVGLGAVLVQEHKGENRVICYISRSLTDTERRYSQTEKEALGIVWACERLHMYLYGTEFLLLTDHKPLECIYSERSTGRASARIHRWVLRLQPYRFTVKYIPGKQNIADSLSRLLPSKGDNSHQEGCSEECENYIRFVAQTATPKALSTRDVEEASADDDELSEIRKCIRTNQWHTLTNKRLLPVKDELCTIGFLVLRGTRILIPESLRETVLEIAHEGHPGIVCMKRRLRTKVWWTGVDKDVEKFVATCHPCQMLGKPQSPEPMKPTELPAGPWQSISADLMSLPSGDCLFVVVDYYSRYFEVDVLRTTTADKIVRSLMKMFLTHGLPLSITTDNGPQFLSSVFQDFLVNQGIEHRRVTPLWPQANGEVERQNRSLLKRVRIAQIEKKDWREELETFLFMYRTTPHSTTGVSPSELMFKRKLRTRLPAIEEFQENLEVTDRDKERKGKGKIYTDDKRNACENDIKAGDKVLLKRKRKDKLTPTFHAEPFRVVSKTGNSVVVEQHDGVQYKRNVTHMRKYHERPDHGVTVQANENVRINRDIDIDGASRENAENTIASSTSGGDVVLDDSQNTYSSVDIDSGVDVDVDGSVGIERSDDSQPRISRSPRPVRNRSRPLRFKDFEL